MSLIFLKEVFIPFNLLNASSILKFVVCVLYDEFNASFGEKIGSINNLLMDAGEGLVNILYPEERVPSEGIFAVPEEERMILNLGKVQ